MAVPSAGMDVQYGPSDLAAQMGTNNMQQQAQNVYWIQPPQFGPLDQQMLFPGLQFVQQPTATVQEQVRIMHKSSQKAIASATAVASKFQLIHRDVALEQLQLQDEQ